MSPRLPVSVGPRLTPATSWRPTVGARLDPGPSRPKVGPRLALRPSGLARAFGALLIATLVVAGCSFGAPSFAATGACTADGQAPGTYPDLEALVPRVVGGRAPTSLDSGRKCTPDGLGTLASHGVNDVRFAGGVWQTAAESGTSLAVFRASSLTAAWLGEYYEAGARSSSKVSGYTASTPTVQGRPAYRLDAENNGNLQTIVAWPDATGSIVRVAIVSGAARDGTTTATQGAAVEAAIAAFVP